MSGCRGPVGGPCPNVNKAVDVQYTQGDMYLCTDCFSVRFPNMKKPGLYVGLPPVADKAKYTCSDILCFIQNKMASSPHDLLCKVVNDFYGEDDIETSKYLLFDSCKGSSRLIKRKGVSKKQNVQDIINRLNESGSEAPIYVAKDLSNLPVTSLESYDLAKMAKELNGLRKELSSVTKLLLSTLSNLNELNERMNVQAASTNSISVNLVEEVTETWPTNSVDLTLSPPAVPNPALDVDAEVAPNAEDVPDPAPDVEAAPTGSADTEGTSTTHIPESSPNNSHPPRGSLDTEGFTTVRGRQRPTFSSVASRPKQNSETARSTHSIRAAPSHHPRKKSSDADLFITRLHSDTTTHDVLCHIKSQIGSNRVTVIQLKTKFDSYTSFKVCVPMNKKLVVEDSKNWPEGVLVKRFFSKKNQ